MLQDARAVRRFRLVRYEDFVATPHDVVLSLVKFLGIDTGSGGGALGEGAALAQPSPGQHVRDMNAGSISRLSIDEKAVVAAEAADLMLRLGYAER
jgi:hypothetical protein